MEVFKMMKKFLSSAVALCIAFPLLSAEAEANSNHEVERGETLCDIALNYKVQLSELLQANWDISNPNFIFPGQEVSIPTEETQDSGEAEEPSFEEVNVEEQDSENAGSKEANEDVNGEEVTTEEATTEEANTEEANTEETSTEESSELSEFEQEVVRLTNVERENQGLAPLQIDEEVSKVARIKSEDMRDQNYFSHQSPTYGSPFDMLSSYDVSYRSAGENIAAGQQTPEQVVQGWMNSQGHRENIMNSGYTHIGVGHVEGGSYGHYWTQMFISK